MTLATHIRVASFDGLTVREVFDHIAQAVGATDPKLHEDTDTAISTVMGQGLPAYIKVLDCKDGTFDIDLDTAYGYRATNGAGCGDLHAAVVLHVINAYPNRAVFWRNEYTGAWHEGHVDDPAWQLEQFEGFGDPILGRIVDVEMVGDAV